MKIILGSGSKFRKEIMERAGYSFDVISADVDERAIRTENPYDLPLCLAEAKAAAILPKIADQALLVTSDTVVICEGRIYEKPLTPDEVRAFLGDYSRVGSADIVTSVLVTNTATEKKASGTDTCKVEFIQAPESAIEEFIRTGDPYSRAGGFSVEDETLAPYIKAEKSTYDSIMGMPLLMLAELLKKVEEK